MFVRFVHQHICEAVSSVRSFGLDYKANIKMCVRQEKSDIGLENILMKIECKLVEERGLDGILRDKRGDTDAAAG